MNIRVLFLLSGVPWWFLRYMAMPGRLCTPPAWFSLAFDLYLPLELFKIITFFHNIDRKNTIAHPFPKRGL